MKIFVASGYGYWGNFNPSDLREGDHQIGGGETAMVSISRELAALGHDVTVFYDVGYFGMYDGVHYLPSNLYTPLVCQMEHDVLVSWDNPQAFRFADRAKLRVLAFQLNHTEVGALDYSIDMYFHPSKWHAERYHELYPEMDERKSRPRITNGIDPTRYNPATPPERIPHRTIYSSSPDRGLHHLLRIWPKVRMAVSDAELHVYYEIDKWLKMVDVMAPPEIVERARIVREFRANDPEAQGVLFHGGIGQAQLATEQMKSAVMAYPCDPTQPTEGFSMTCLEAVTAGCSLVTTDADALQELWADAPDVTILPLPVNDELWVNTVVKLLERDEARPLRDPVQYYWSTIAQRWVQEFLECLPTTPSP